MQARTFNQSRLVAAGLAFAAAVAAVLVFSALSDSGAGSIEAPSATPAATQAAPPVNRTSSKRSVIVQSGRSAKGRSVTVQGAPGESATATAQPGGAAPGSTAMGGAGGSATAKGGSTTSGSVALQAVGP